ncbi:putative NADH-flavin reductase [Tritrichomonas foetus]|uniref:NADH-flavin reductase n=1 Tax=Tritrichomonas foetus TaxID=1144522 RepID=A0A1J4KHS3_9EUKA|nr:putative NADH-flavin reductase [Tritrichomonas foetus]|eukprot:OHT10943.1 putative NADH-flavin reductase [Tritrichomonas foetus]
MKVAVLCANGKAGQLIVTELLSRGVEVTAIVRGENRSKAPKAIIKDIFTLTSDDLNDFDVIINCFGVFADDLLDQFTSLAKQLCDALSGKTQRLLIVGGAGSLYTDETHQTQMFDTPDFPEIYKKASKAHGQSLEYYRTRSDVKWTYVSPALDFVVDGAKTGKYTLIGEEVKFNSKGESAISYADFATAIVDEALNGNHIQQRISFLTE